MRTMTDSHGNEVPIGYVPSFDRARDAAAKRILARFVKARGQLEKLVADCLADLDVVKLDKSKIGEKGNFQMTSFDGNIQIAVRQSYRILLDERVSRARELMFNFAKNLAGLVQGKNGEALLKIITEAFSDNKSGMLSIGKVLSLLSMEIDSPDWQEARKLLQDSIKPEKSKAYLACYRRADRQHDYVPIRLDIADCWPEEAPHE